MILNGALLFSGCCYPPALCDPIGCRLPCPSWSPRVCLNSYLSSQWCHPTTSSSVTLFSSCPQSFPASGSFPVSQLSHQVAKVLDLQLQHQSFQWIFRANFLLGWLLWSPCSPRHSQESSLTPQFKASILQCSAFFMVHLSHLYMTTGKTMCVLSLWSWPTLCNCMDCSRPGFSLHGIYQARILE